MQTITETHNTLSMKIPIIAGHTRTAPGAIAYDGTTEHDLNVELQSMIVGGFNDSVIFQGSSMQPITDDEHLCLRSVINLINGTRRAEYGLDIHFNNNNPNASGVEAFVHPNTMINNRLRAQFLVDNISEILGISNRGVKAPSQSALGSLAIIEQTKIPMILLEVCFLNNRDLPLYRQKKSQIANMIKDAMMNAAIFF